MSGATYRLLGEEEELEPTGGVHVKGKGIMDTYVWPKPSSCRPDASRAGGPLVVKLATGHLDLAPAAEGGLWPSLTRKYCSTPTYVHPPPSGLDPGPVHESSPGLASLGLSGMSMDPSMNRITCNTRGRLRQLLLHQKEHGSERGQHGALSLAQPIPTAFAST